ncbi:CapA family protein [Parvibaculum sp.]|uniref:CapA family protein n=1 Tax=Parvibaculum sp. TaxID=2024848 RepID=UPI00320FDF46
MKLLLTGDVMLGRGIDQILEYPSDPKLYERYIGSAGDYVQLAENAHGHIDRPVAPDYVWGDALTEIDRHAPDLRIVNLETAITTAKSHAPKGINYRMNPGNADVLRALRIDACSLANNHVLDWGRRGLAETIETLERIGIASSGAGHDRETAQAPAILRGSDGRRVLLFGAATPDSGVPLDWAAADRKPGIALLPDLSEATIETVARRIAAHKAVGDVVVLSLHWGGNWGYRIRDEENAFAHALIERAGVDVLHGHSSHHTKGIEVYRGKLILYGCGDFINDYEGIPGHEGYRSDLALAFVASIDEENDNSLSALSIVPFRIARFQLQLASAADTNWLQDVLTRESAPFGLRFVGSGPHELKLAHQAQ